MKVLTYTSYIENCNLYTKIHGSIAVKAGARIGKENNRFIKFSLSAGTYSIDDFNAKIKAAVLKEKQD